MNPFMKLSKADFTLVDPQIRTGKGVKFADVAGLKVIKIKQFLKLFPELIIEYFLNILKSVSQI